MRAHLRQSCLLVPLLTLTAFAVSPVATDHPGNVHPWTSLSVEPATDSFQFAIVADRTGGARPGIFEKAVDKLNLLQPQFVMSVGDLIEGYTDKPDEVTAMRDEFDAIVAKLQLPFFYVAGNHDVQEPACFDEWQRRFGRAYYSFTYQNVLFVCLDSVHLDKDQTDWALETLKGNQQARWTLVFMHYPLWRFTPQEATNYKNPEMLNHWVKIENALADRPHTVFAGHYHEYARYQRQGQSYYVLATTGGVSSAPKWEDYPSLGDFDHVVWVTMTDQGPRVANLLLSGVLADDVADEQSSKAMNAFGHGAENSVVVAPPIFIKSAQFREGTVEASIRNGSDVPMQAWLAFEPHAQLRPSPAAAVVAVAPNSTQTLAVTVSAEAPVDTTVAPLELNVLTTFTAPDGQEFTQRASHLMPIVRRQINPCGRAGQPVTVDGNLSDWDGLPFVVAQPVQILKNAAAWTGPEDCAYRFGVSFDLKNLYIAVQVTDGDVINDKGDEPWEQDGVEVRLDARTEPDRSMGRGNTDFKETVLAALVPVDRKDKQRGYRLAELPEGSQAVCVTTKDGYVAEIAIPLDYLKKQQGDPWDMFRLDVAVDDRDKGDKEGAQLHWIPDWRTPEDYPGSGTFQRVNP